MEMGIPGLPTPALAVDAEIDALREGVSAMYPPAAGIPELKTEMSRFARLFLNVSVHEEGCLPTVGSLNGSFLAFLVAGSMSPGRDTVLFLDPGFPVHRLQVATLGLRARGLDIAESRGRHLGTAVREAVADGRVCAILYSNPNNPTWMCLSADELREIGAIASENQIIVIEDLAYFAMDFRQPLGSPGRPPYQPTIASFMDRYVILVSSSKVFSYAGQRVGMLYVSNELFHARFPHLRSRFPFHTFGDALILGALYGASAGVGHSAQRGLAALLRAANDGDFNFREYVRPYVNRAIRMKEIFTGHGFSIVYDRDDAEPIADGFYFTVGYPGFSGPELVSELLRYGISAISLEGTGACRNAGIRACVSLVTDGDLSVLDDRLAAFRGDHPA